MCGLTASTFEFSQTFPDTEAARWYMPQRLREACDLDDDRLRGIIEIDETDVGGKESAKHEIRKLHTGRSPVGKRAVMSF